MRFRYKCHDCGWESESDRIEYLCPVCGGSEKEGEFRKGILSVIYDEEDIRKLRDKKDLSVYDFLPYSIANPAWFPCGPTSVVHSRRIREKYGRKVSFKMDSQLLSGSFKDRASLLVANQALHFNENRIALASTGNAGAAMSAIGAAYGLDIILFVPYTAPANKLMQSVLYGAHVVPVKGTYDDAFALSLEYTREKGGINRNTAYNPMTIEGKKACSIELFLQLGRKAPDTVYVPTGDGCILGGIYKGFYDLVQAGLIDKLPRLVCCQSSRSDAIAKAFETGEYRNVSASTIADSISVSSPANGRMAVRAIKESGGWATIVTDDDILAAQRELAALSGLFVEPASAAAYAAFIKDSSRLDKDEEVTVLLTGTGFKDMAVFDGKITLPSAIENDKAEIRKLPF